MSRLLTFGEASAIIWGFTSFSIILTATRLYTRAFIVKAFGLDDGLILFGQVIMVQSRLEKFSLLDRSVLTQIYDLNSLQLLLWLQLGPGTSISH